MLRDGRQVATQVVQAADRRQLVRLMADRDVEELFEMVAVGDAVELHEERTPELDRIFGPVAVPATLVAQSAAPVRTAALQ